jgi:cell division protein FtsL
MNLRLISVLLLGLAVMATAFGVVVSKHETRQQYKALVSLENARDDMDVEWGKLQLEQSSWATHGRVETQARERLKMSIPDIGDAVMITP